MHHQKSLLLALGVAASLVVADDFHVNCDGNEQPNYDDCDQLMQMYKNSASYYPSQTSNTCYFASPPDGVDPNSLNCVVYVCPTDSNVYYTDVGTAYAIIHDQCGGANAGGTFDDTTLDYTVTAELNTHYNPPSKRAVGTNTTLSVIPAAAKERAHARDVLTKRDSSCSNGGSGTLELLVTSDNVEKDGTQQAVTGRLPAGSSYMIQTSDAKTIGVSVSISVEAGFFDLFDASTSTTISADDTTTTTTGVTVNVDCDDGQEGIIYIYPVFTEYKTICTSDSPHQEIDVWSPAKTQNNYMVQCLGTGSK